MARQSPRSRSSLATEARHLGAARRCPPRPARARLSTSPPNRGAPPSRKAALRSPGEVGVGLEPPQRVPLELADALAREPELLADRLERCGLAVEAKPKL